MLDIPLRMLVHSSLINTFQERSTSRPAANSWPWMKFSNTKTESNDNDNKNEANNWEDGTEALPYEVLEKRFVSIIYIEPIQRVVRFYLYYYLEL